MLSFSVGVTLSSHAAFAGRVGECSLWLSRVTCHHLGFTGVGGESCALEKSGEGVNGQLEPVTVGGLDKSIVSTEKGEFLSHALAKAI